MAQTSKCVIHTYVSNAHSFLDTCRLDRTFISCLFPFILLLGESFYSNVGDSTSVLITARNFLHMLRSSLQPLKTNKQTKPLAKQKKKKNTPYQKFRSSDKQLNFTKDLSKSQHNLLKCSSASFSLQPLPDEQQLSAAEILTLSE